MNPDEIQFFIQNLSKTDKQQMMQQLIADAQTQGGFIKDLADKDKSLMSSLTFSSLPQMLARELKQQNITFEEMSMQIGVSLSTFKRLMANPSAAKASNVHALLRELGLKVWLEK